MERVTGGPGGGLGRGKVLAIYFFNSAFVSIFPLTHSLHAHNYLHSKFSKQYDYHFHQTYTQVHSETHHLLHRTGTFWIFLPTSSSSLYLSLSLSLDDQLSTTTSRQKQLNCNSFLRVFIGHKIEWSHTLRILYLNQNYVDLKASY